MSAVAPATVRLAASISRRAAASSGVEEGALGEREDGVGVEHVVALLGQALEVPAQLGAAGVEALRAGAERARAASRSALACDGGGLGVEAVDAGEAAEGPELADELDERP